MSKVMDRARTEWRRIQRVFHMGALLACTLPTCALPACASVTSASAQNARVADEAGFAQQVETAEEADNARAAGRALRWELGLGLSGGWSVFREAGHGDTFHVLDRAAFGVELSAGWRISQRLTLLGDMSVASHDTSLEDIKASQSLATLGFRYLALEGGGVGPWLYGGFGAAGMRLDPVEGEGETLSLTGIVGVFGGGLRLALSPRLQCDLALKHAVVNYRDDEVILESIYAGNRIDKAGANTRLTFNLRLLF